MPLQCEPLYKPNSKNPAPTLKPELEFGQELFHLHGGATQVSHRLLGEVKTVRHLTTFEMRHRFSVESGEAPGTTTGHCPKLKFFSRWAETSQFPGPQVQLFESSMRIRIYKNPRMKRYNEPTKANFAVV